MNRIDWYVGTIVLGLWLLFFLILICTGCAAFKTTPTIETIPVSGWESVMKAVAKSNWVITFCLLAFFSGVVTTAMDAKKMGISIILASITTLFLGLAVHRFPTPIAVIGFIGSAGACVLVVLKRKKALIEIIRGVQRYRDNSIEHDDLDGYFLRQSPSTKKIVKQIKAKVCTSEPETN